MPAALAVENTLLVVRAEKARANSSKKLYITPA